MEEVYRRESEKGKGGTRVNRELDGLAIYRGRGEEFRSLGGGRYEVPSRSVQGRRHEVSVEHETCSCEDHKIRGLYCAHIFAATVAAAKPHRIKSKERVRFTAAEIERNLSRMGA